MRTISCLTACLLIVAVGPATARAEVIPIGQTDNFNVVGALENWGGGATRTNIASGGPDGSRYLQISPGGQGKVGAYNLSQWAGDYLTAGITGIAMDAKNDGPQTVELRLLFLRGSDEYAAINPLVLPAGSGWQHYVFGVSAGDLTQVAGTNSLSYVLAGVNRLLMHHDPNPPNSTSGGSPAVNATVGIDNITAVPEPATWLLLVIAGLCLLGHARRRRTTL
jgi:hypothetical protein